MRGNLFLTHRDDGSPRVKITPVREAERATFFGERLPSGLRLMEG